MLLPVIIIRLAIRIQQFSHWQLLFSALGPGLN